LRYSISNIYFNKQCLKRGLTPDYARIKVPRTSPALKFTQQKIPRVRLTDELKFLHIKKQQLNQQIFKAQLFLANFWDKLWPDIQYSVESKLKNIIKEKYKRLEAKLAKLTREQVKKPNKNHTLFPRLVNLTSITFSERETRLLNKGPRYNLHTKRPDWLTNLALEAETAVTQLPPPDRELYRKQVANRIEKLHKCEDHTHKHAQQETHTAKSIRSKLKRNNATIAKADKGNSLVTIPSEQYEDNTEIR
jgi:hypothetical protein